MHQQQLLKEQIIILLTVLLSNLPISSPSTNRSNFQQPGTPWPGQVRTPSLPLLPQDYCDNRTDGYNSNNIGVTANQVEESYRATEILMPKTVR